MKIKQSCVNDFGKFCRMLRIKNDIILKNMSDILGVSPAYLSAVENGKRKIPSEWGNIIKKNFYLTVNEKKELDRIIQTQTNSFFEEFNVNSTNDRDMLVQLARRCKDITPNKFEQIMKILGEEKANESKTAK